MVENHVHCPRCESVMSKILVKPHVSLGTARVYYEHCNEMFVKIAYYKGKYEGEDILGDFVDEPMEVLKAVSIKKDATH